jgi:DNA polymerase-4
VSPVAERHIAHLDMDAFFASVELLSRPGLAGLPVVVGGRRSAGQDGTRLADYAGRGVVTTATYPARAFGIHSGMGLMKAARLCPDALLLPADFEAYRRHSRLFKAAVRERAPRIEDRGIDEIYIDFDATADGALEHGRVLALQLQHDVRTATGLSCSLGVAPNKLLAKIASDLDKPGGITILRQADVPVRVWPLPCRRINGIGPRSAERLAALGLNTIGELAACERGWLIEQFGTRHGGWLHEVAWGRDSRDLSTGGEPVSMSRETTFERDLHAVRDRAELGAQFTRQCEQVAADLQRKGYVGRNVGIKLRFADFTTVTRAITLEHGIADGAAIRRAAGQCLKRAPLEQRIRLLGVRVGHLERPGAAAAAHAVREPGVGDDAASRGDEAGTLPLF